jgi:hypothetical protein
MSTAQVYPDRERLHLVSPSSQRAPRTANAIALLGFSAPMLAFARRAASAGVRVYLIDLVSKPSSFVRLSNAVEPVGITLDRSLVGTPEGLDAIRGFVGQVHADALLTSDDYALTWLGRNRRLFEPACTIMAPDPAVLESLLDKYNQTACAIQSGFETLPGWLLTFPEVIRAIPGYAYPVVIRPSQPYSAHPTFKARVISTRRALTDLYASTRWTHPPIVQQFCLGPNYVLHGMRAQSGEFLAWQLFKAYRKYRGFAVSIESEPVPPALERAARRFVESEGLTGPFHFDLLRAESDDSFYFLEINCRLGGTTVRALQLGYDEPGLLLQAFNLETPQPLTPLPAGAKATSIALNLSQVLGELRNRRDPLAYPRISRTRSLFAALREVFVVPDGLLSRRDPLSCLQYSRWHGRG